MCLCDGGSAFFYTRKNGIEKSCSGMLYGKSFDLTFSYETGKLVSVLYKIKAG